jgi:para-aminobenzoate synthetase / 4-amino-4-deoxychorismate lyase
LIKRILLKDKLGETLVFSNPVEVLYARNMEEVRECISNLDSYKKKGFYVAGYLSYESGWAFVDQDKVTHSNVLPLCAFGIYRDVNKLKVFPKIKINLSKNLEFKPNISRKAYDDSIIKIHEEIRRGNTYQVNFTFLLQAKNIYTQLSKRLIDLVPWPYSACIEAEDFSIYSASPELFFQKELNSILCKPMKGTMRRDKDPIYDRLIKERLKKSNKDKAENIMITDMVRNDLGKICDPASVLDSDLCNVEPFPTVWQMTSSVTGKSNASIETIFKALFPSASITGAPKHSTMKIIRDMEVSPREIYTGAIGYIDPNGDAQFSVAIRTLQIDHKKEVISYGIGSGITIDSVSNLEYQECLDKARVLNMLLV